jgi:NADH pyrophosphatase NudC (nudix superfamily)
MAKKRYTLVLNFGYVESQRLAYMPWTSKQTFKDAKEALVDLANFLKERYLEENKTDLKKCCLKTREKDATAEFCSKCGHALAEEEFDGERFSEWLRDLDTDIDTFHGYISWDPDARWQAEGM